MVLSLALPVLLWLAQLIDTSPPEAWMERSRW